MQCLWYLHSTTLVCKSITSLRLVQTHLLLSPLQDSFTLCIHGLSSDLLKPHATHLQMSIQQPSPGACCAGPWGTPYISKTLPLLGCTAGQSPAVAAPACISFTLHVCLQEIAHIPQFPLACDHVEFQSNCLTLPPC